MTKYTYLAEKNLFLHFILSFNYMIKIIIKTILKDKILNC